jgi:exonuclease VII small subunit
MKIEETKMTEKFQFEKALAELEGIVEALEGGELTLDEALKRKLKF